MDSSLSVFPLPGTGRKGFFGHNISSWIIAHFRPNYKQSYAQVFQGKAAGFSPFFSAKGAKIRPGKNVRFPGKWGQETEALRAVRTMETIHKKNVIFRGKLYGSFRKKA
ncbi:MAG: hypothetical protein SO002_05915 [Candidatus Faecousia sp.]|nr:hypothetical protein [Candidatus Faecousia sp.]